MRLHAILAGCLATFAASAAAVPQAPAPARVQRLADVQDSYPVPSPDGSRILFQSDRSGEPALWVMAADGSGARPLGPAPLNALTPDWSPDATLIVAAAGQRTVGSDTTAIVLLAADGSDWRPLPLPQGSDVGHPKWSPDGNRIIFNSNHETPDASAPWHLQWHDIYSVRPDGSDLRRHTRCRSVCTYPQFSPDMQRITYRKVVAAPGLDWELNSIERNSDIFVANLDGSNEINLSRHAAFDGWPTWSPDGRQVVFASARLGVPQRAALFLVNADGSGLRQLTGANASYAQPRFAADGRSILAYRNEEGSDDTGASFETGVVVRILLDPAPAAGS